MSRQRRTADDFVRDMKAKQQRSTLGDIERKNQRRADSRTGRRVARKPGPDRLAGTHSGEQEHPQPPQSFVTKGSPLPAALDCPERRSTNSA
jgi:hypothetical protein